MDVEALKQERAKLFQIQQEDQCSRSRGSEERVAEVGTERWWVEGQMMQGCVSHSQTSGLYSEMGSHGEV